MTAAIAGAGIGAVALLADLVVSGLLGMDLGQGGLRGADMLAFALALGLFAPGFGCGFAHWRMRSAKPIMEPRHLFGLVSKGGYWMRRYS
jgi:hypothetical protein